MNPADRYQSLSLKAFSCALVLKKSGILSVFVKLICLLVTRTVCAVKDFSTV